MQIHIVTEFTALTYKCIENSIFCSDKNSFCFCFYIKKKHLYIDNTFTL